MRRAKVPVLPGQGLLLSKADFEGPSGLVLLDKTRAQCVGCTKCPLHENRTQVVFGEGPWDSPPIAFVGEGPGYYEDVEGRPFVGRSGDLLNRVLDAIGLPRGKVFITNAVLCRPPDNRQPTEEELGACAEHLKAQLVAVKPGAVVALGKTAAHALLPEKESMRHMRGRWHTWNGFRVRVTWHPAYVLRKDREDGGESRWQMWDDLTSVLEVLGLPVPPRARRTDA